MREMGRHDLGPAWRDDTVEWLVPYSRETLVVQSHKYITAYQTWDVKSGVLYVLEISTLEEKLSLIFFPISDEGYRRRTKS